MRRCTRLTTPIPNSALRAPNFSGKVTTVVQIIREKQVKVCRQIAGRNYRKRPAPSAAEKSSAQYA
jgi:hypothetical protein